MRKLLGLILRIASCFLFCCSLSVIAQNQHKVDSLNSFLQAQVADSNKVVAYIALAEEYYLSSPDKAIVFCEKAKLLAEKIQFSNGLSSAFGWLAYLYEQQGEVDKALEYYFKSLEIFTRLGNKMQLGVCFNNIAAIYKNKGNIPEALRYHYKSLFLHFEIANKGGIATSYNNLALIYQNQGRIPQALDYFSKAQKIYEKIGDSEGIATTFDNIGAMYKQQKQYAEAADFFRKSYAISAKQKDKYAQGYSLNAIGGLLEEQNKIDSALYYFKKSLQIRIAFDDKQGIAYTYKNMGNCYVKQKQYDAAIEAYKRSIADFQKVEDKWGMAIVYNLYGAILIQQNKIEEGEAFLKKSLNFAQALGYPENIQNAAFNLQSLYRKQGLWKEALEMNDVYERMKDSVQNDKSRKAALQSQFRYEYEKKEAVLKEEQVKKDALAKAEIKRQKLMRNGFVSGFAVVLLFAALIFRQRNHIAREKQRSDNLLLNILPLETAEELKATGTAKAKDFEEVSILFTDFKNFTRMSEEKTAQELVNDINFCYSEFDKIVSEFNVEKIKTIGDAYMCAGGLPLANTTHAADTVKAAIAMRNFMLAEKQKRNDLGKDFFEIRIGIHTGPVVAGIVGTKKFAYDIWGDAVNVAARMESSGEAGKINISGPTYERVKNQFKCSYRGKIQAKNKGEIDMYFVD